MIEWLLTPIDLARGHSVEGFVAWHGRLMVLAWAILFPTGIILARFFKVTPGQDYPNRVDNQFWWYCHLAFQYGGGAAVVVALWLILNAPPTGLESFQHRLFGWVVFGMCALQFLGGWFRGTKGGPTEVERMGTIRGDHYDMTPRRQAFEYIHKINGYLAILLATVATLTGLWVANAPHWMWIIIPVWWAVIGLVYAILQRKGLAMDSYPAIWGPGQEHPGNRSKPIGWGLNSTDLNDPPGNDPLFRVKR